LFTHCQMYAIFIYSVVAFWILSKWTQLTSLIMVQRFNAHQPLATTLFSSEATLEFTTRLAKLVARRAQMPVYVTNSMSFENAGMGGTVEEEMEAFRSIAEVTLARLQKAGLGASAALNGVTGSGKS
jgi:hypothetical protein